MQSILQSQPWLINKKQLWLRRMIIPAILALSIVIPVTGSPGRLQLILLFGSGILGVLLLMRWPALGFITILLGSMFIPQFGPAGLNIAVLAVSGLVVFWLAEMVIRHREIQIVTSRPIRPVLVFILLSILSFGAGQIRWYMFARQAPLDAQLGGLAIHLLSAGAFLLVAHLVVQERWLEILTWLFTGSAFLAVLGQLLPGVGSIVLGIFQNGATGSMFWTWLAALAFGQAVFNSNLRPWLRILLIVAVSATFYVSYFKLGDWKSGWVPSLAAILVILAFRYPRRFFYLSPIMALAGWILAGKIIGTDLYSWGTRLDAWKVMLDVVKANPILGMGFANYYWYTPLFPIRGWYVNFNSHSQYIDLIAQTGILGLVCFLWIFWEVGRLGWSLRHHVPKGFARAYVYGVLGGLVGTLFAAALVDWVLPFVYNIGLSGFRSSVLAWLFMGGLVSLEQIYHKRQET